MGRVSKEHTFTSDQGRPTRLKGLQAEDFLEHVAQAVVAELDGAMCNMQLLFGVNTVARAEFQRILQELTHWNPLLEVGPVLAYIIPVM